MSIKPTLNLPASISGMEKDEPAAGASVGAAAGASVGAAVGVPQADTSTEIAMNTPNNVHRRRAVMFLLLEKVTLQSQIVSTYAFGQWLRGTTSSLPSHFRAQSTCLWFRPVPCRCSPDW